MNKIKQTFKPFNHNKLAYYLNIFFRKMVTILIKKGKKDLLTSTFLNSLFIMKWFAILAKEKFIDIPKQIIHNLQVKAKVVPYKVRKNTFYVPKILNRLKQMEFIARIIKIHLTGNTKQVKNNILNILSNELIQCYILKSTAIKYKEDVSKEALENKKNFVLFRVKKFIDKKQLKKIRLNNV